jgi:hypothetical protein
MPSARPILFTGAMVRALIDGTKTQTRRLVREQGRLRAGRGDDGQPATEYLNQWGSWQPWVTNAKTMRCPYGQPGELLWVRETWAVSSIYDGVRPRDVPRFGVRYAATGERRGIKNRPNIFMPRWASRLTLRLTGIRAQRLHDIGEADALAEGIEHAIRPFGDWKLIDGIWDASLKALQTGEQREPPPRIKYAHLWNTINAADGIRWADNPWVWALTFTVHQANVDAVLAEAAAPAMETA